MSLEAIKELLCQKMGLDVATIGDSSLKHALEHRLALSQRDSLQSYFRLLNVERKELDALIEDIVVPETWFYRNTTPFTAFVELVRQLQKQRLGQKAPLQILSVPCSTGEEPYSLALALVEAGISLQHIQITGLDISRAAIEVAKTAAYRKNALRELPEDLQRKYFEHKAGRYCLLPEIKQHVRFEQGNVIIHSLGPTPGYYHIVFCRNLLIYFNEVTRNRLYLKIHQALTKGGYLFVGHAEAAGVDKKRFKSALDPKAYAFIKQHVLDTDISKPAQEAVKSAPAPMATGQSIISLNFVEQLIDKGDDARAEHLLSQYLQMQPDSAEAHYLQGKRLFVANQFKVAETALKKSLYLKPDHVPSLNLLIQIAEKTYNLDAVRGYRDKLKRLRRR